MCIRSLFCLFAILAMAWGPHSFAKQKPQPLLISAYELGKLPYASRALYVVEFLKFMQHLEEFQKKYGMDYASYFDFLIPTAEAQTAAKCFYGMHIRNAVRGYCFHDTRSGDRDLTKNVDCKESVKILNKQNNTFQTYQAVMACPSLLFDKEDGGVYCTKLDDGASEGCINHLRDNPSAPLEQSANFKRLVNKLAACGSSQGAPSYCAEWNQYQKDFDVICPGRTQGVKMLCREITPFLTTLRAQVGLDKTNEPEKLAAAVVPASPVTVTNTLPPVQPPVITLATPPPSQPEEVPAQANKKPQSISADVGAEIEKSAPPIQPKPAKPVEAQPALNTADIKNIKAGEHTCSRRLGGYPKFENNFACIICPIENEYEKDDADYKISDRYVSMLSVVQGGSCESEIEVDRPLPQKTLQLVNRFGYCSDEVYSWDSGPSEMVKKWNANARDKDEDYQFLFAAKARNFNARKEGRENRTAQTAQEKAFQEAYGLDILTASDLYCAKSDEEFNKVLSQATKIDADLQKCLKESVVKREKIRQSRGCYNFSQWHKEGQLESQKISSQVQIDNLLRQQYVIRFEHSCESSNAEEASAEKCEVLELRTDKATKKNVVYTVQPSQVNPMGGYLEGRSEPESFVRQQMQGASRTCAYQYADFSRQNCMGPKVEGAPASPAPAAPSAPASGSNRGTRGSPTKSQR